MKVHADRYFKITSEAEHPSPLELERMLSIVEEAYQPVVWVLPDDFDSYDRFVKVVYRLDWSSSPGYPYMLEKPTIGEWMNHDGVQVGSYELGRLWFDVRKVLDGDYYHIWRTFVKMEPHKISKIREGRWRIIMACSLPVQVVWHMLFDYQNDLEIDKCYEIPSQQGVKLVNGGWRDYYRLWKARGYDVGLDMSAWDWTVPSWLFDAELILRKRLGRGSRMGDWYELARRMYDDAFVHPRILVSNGIVLQQVKPGIMKSGCVNTISTNSRMQIMLHVLACWKMGAPVHPLPVACGDDKLQRSEQAYDVTAYTCYGPVVKSASAGLEFVGHEFTETGPHPLYMFKHVFAFKYVSDEVMPQYLEAMVRMYIHTEHVHFWYELAHHLGHISKLKSLEYYKFWYDNEV